jgi:tRNA dimethylallyltransferase
MTHPGPAAPVLPILVGATASGKTAVAIEVARRLRGVVALEIVSADSRQVYRGLDVGTAKPNAAERAAVPHHLLDVVDPRETYTAARFARDARAAFAEVRARGAVPFLVGGSGLYVRAAEQGLFEGPAADEALRARLQAEADAGGEAALHARLARVDPETARRLHPRDRVRVIRALEVWETTGTPIAEHHRRHRAREPDLRPRRFQLDWPTGALDARISARTDAMLDGGWEDEVRGLLGAGVPATAPGLDAVGYPQVRDLVAGRASRAEAREAIVRATRQFAKRQRTWFRAVRDLRVLRVAAAGDLPRAVEELAEALRAELAAGAWGAA